MKRSCSLLAGFAIVAIVVIVMFQPSLTPTNPPETSEEFPDFFTSNEDYFVTRIGSVPVIDREIYRLNVHGLIDNHTSFTLPELWAMDLIDLPLTVECIGNSQNGRLVGTAMYRGFNVYDMLVSLGLFENATGVRYIAADGYYASHTLDQLRDNGVLGALFMNNEELPVVQGFPLRILNPGYYGVKQPAWVTEIEVIDRPLEDYWEDRGWDTSPPMDIDSIIFFPSTSTTTVNVSQRLSVGGSAFGGTRVKLVEYTLDDGATWNNAPIVQQIDADNVWVFWQIDISFPEVGLVTMKIRATDINDVQQTKTDSNFLDGYSAWPVLEINVI